ncbi:hypothetical protein BC830DRAFT_660973 [Chytriomyces sp. MP71]|nr:hypothetical protein BC830DRAFT_660973 [Chytriomyces sp. MP71]
MHAKTIHHAKEYTLRYSSTSRPTAPTPVRRSGLSFRGRGLLELKAQRGLVEGMGTRVRPEVVFAATVERERVFDGDVAHVLQAVNAEKRRSRRESGNQAMVGVEFKSTLLGGSVREEPVVQVVPFLTEEVDAWASVIPGKTVVEEIVEGSVESVASKASKATTESDSWLAAERAKLFQDWGRRESDASGSKTTDSNEKVAEISSHESKEYSSRLESPSSTSEVKMITSKLDTDFISHESIKSISPVLDSFNSMRSASKDEFKYSKDELANQPVVLTPVATLAIDGLDEPNWGDMVSPEASALSSAAVEVVAHSDLIVQQHSNLIPEPVTKTMADSKILPGSASIHTSKTSLNLPSTTEPDYLKNAWTAELPIALPVVEQTIFTCTPQSEAEGPNAQSQESPSRLVSMIRNGIHEDNDAGKLSRRHSKTSDQSGSSVISMTDHSADDDTQKRSSEIFGSFKLKSASNSSTSLFSKLKGGHHSDRKSSKNNEGSLHAIESKSKSQRSSETKSPISQSVTPSMECLKEDDGEPKDESKKQASISSLKSMSSGVRSLVGKIKSSHHSLGPESLIKSQQVLKSSEKLDLLNATKSLLEPSSPIRPVEPVKMDVLIESAAISDLPLATKSNFSPIDVVQPATYAAETASEASKQSEMEVSKTTPESCQQSLKESGPRAPSPATKPIMSSNKSSQESLKANVPGKVMKSESQKSVASQLVPTTVTSKLLKSSDGVIASAKAAWEAEANKQSVKIPVSMQRSESEVPSPAPICQQVLAATDVASIEKATKNKTRNESDAAIFGPKNSDAFDSKSLEQLKMSPPGTYASRIGGEQKPAVSLKSIKLATVTTSDKERKVVFKEPQTTSVITVKPGLPATLQAEVAKSPDIEHKAKNAPSPEIQTTSTANTSIPLQTSEPLTELETACSVAVPVPKQFDPNSSSNAIPLKPKSSKFMSAMDQMNLEKQELPEHLRKESPESGEPSVKELWDSSRKSFQKSSNNITSTLSPTASKFTESETDMESVKKVDAVVSIEASPAEKEKKRIQETNARPADIMIQATPAEKEKLRQQDAVMQAETPPTAVTTSNNAEASSRKKVEEPKAPLPTAEVMSAKVTFEKAKCQVRVENGEFTCIDEKTNKPLLPSLEMRRIVKADNTPGRPEVTLHVCAPRDKGKAGSKFRELVLSFEGGPSKAKVWADGLMVLVYGAGESLRRYFKY